MQYRFARVFEAISLELNSSRAVVIGALSVLVCNADGEFFAVENVCSHQANPLEGGRIRRCTLSCPLHGMPFDLRTGEPRGQLTNKPLRTFPVRVVDGVVEVGLPPG